jgi:hypothetical protein
MASKLDEEEIVEILEVYHEVDSQAETAERVGVSDTTVKKYLDEYYEEWAAEAEKAEIEQQDDDPEQDQAENANGASTDEQTERTKRTKQQSQDQQDNFTAQPPSESPLSSNGADQQELSRQQKLRSMNCGEFITWFFEQRGHGVNPDFALNLSNMCNVRNEIPDRDMIKRRLLEGASGIGNESDADMVAETYWVVAQDYMDANGRDSRAQDPAGGWQDPEKTARGEVPQSGGGSEWNDGDWQSPGEDREQQGRQSQGQQQSQEPQASEGSWGRPGQGGQQNGAQQRQGQGRGQQPRQQPGGRAARGQRGQPPQFMGNGQQNQQGGTDKAVKQIAQVVKGVQQTQERILDELNGGRGGGQGQGPTQDPQSLKEQMREFREAKEEMEAIAQAQGGGQDEDLQQIVSHFQDQISQLEQQIATGGGGGGAGGGADEMTALVQLAQQDNVDKETLALVSEGMGTTDPEVKKAEYELKKEETRAQNRREMIDSVFDNLGDVAEQAGGGLVESILSGGDDDGGQPPQQPDTRRQQPQDAQQRPQGQRQAQPRQPQTRRAEPDNPTRNRFEELQDQEVGGDAPGDGEIEEPDPDALDEIAEGVAEAAEEQG